MPLSAATFWYAFLARTLGLEWDFFPFNRNHKSAQFAKKKLADIFQRRGAGIFLLVSISNKNTDVMPALQKAFEADAYRKEFTYMMLSNLSSFSRPMPARSSFQIFQHGFQLNPRHQFSFSEMRRRVKFWMHEWMIKKSLTKWMRRGKFWATDYWVISFLKAAAPAPSLFRVLPVAASSKKSHLVIIFSLKGRQTIISGHFTRK